MQSLVGTKINKLLGLQLVATSTDSATIRMPASEDFVQEKGVIHGGILATLADAAAVYSFMPYLDESQLAASIEFKVNFLAPAFAAAGELIAVGKVAKRGNKVIVCESSVSQAGKEVARGLFTYLVWEK